MLIIGAVSLVTWLTTSYQQAAPPSSPTTFIPVNPDPLPPAPQPGLGGLMVEVVTGLLGQLVVGLGEPIVNLLEDLSRSTPVISDNQAIWQLWVISVGLSNSLLVLMVIFLGARSMVAPMLGWQSQEWWQLGGRILLTFILANTSLWLIDGLIRLTNAILVSLHQQVSSADFWGYLTPLVTQTGWASLAMLLGLVILVLLAGWLAVYYVGRLIGLYVGAVLAPLVITLGLLPTWRPFSRLASQAYLGLIAILVVHNLILLVATTILTDINATGTNSVFLVIMVSLATLVCLVRSPNWLTQATMQTPTTWRHLRRQARQSWSASHAHIGSSRSASWRYNLRNRQS